MPVFSLKSHQDAVSDKCVPGVQVAGKAWPYGEALLFLPAKSCARCPTKQKEDLLWPKGLVNSIGHNMMAKIFSSIRNSRKKVVLGK